MSNFTIISDISNAIVKTLINNMVPDVILSADGIGVANPADKGDLSLCVYLYDVAESEDMRVSGLMPAGLDKQTYPPSYLTLNYMITAYSISDVKFRAAEEYRILGRAIQVLKDNPVIRYADLGSSFKSSMDSMTIEMLRINSEEKMKLWNFPNVPYRLSLFYRVSPVELASTKSRKTSRVTDAEFVVDEKTRF